MAYAFENTPWHLVPIGEQIAIAIMQSQIRDNMLTYPELYAKEEALREMRNSNV